MIKHFTRTQIRSIAFGAVVAAALLAPGTEARAAQALDPSFGDGGAVVYREGLLAAPRFYDVAVYGAGPMAGRIVAVGSAGGDRETHPLLVVLNSGGDRLASYMARLPGTIGPSGIGGQHFDSVAIDSDGKILVAGGGSVAPGERGVFAARFNPDASLDTDSDADPDVAFGPDAQGFTGFAGLETGSVPSAALTVVGSGPAGGDIMLAGSEGDETRGSTANLTRLSGSGDPIWTNSYGLSAEPADIPDGSSNEPTEVGIQPDGDVVVAGTQGLGGSDRWGVVSYKPDGSLDLDFGAGGGATLEWPGGRSTVSGMALDADGRILLAGQDLDGGSAVQLARLGSDGAIDPAFGQGGRASHRFGLGAGTDIALDGSRIVGGGTVYGGGGAHSVAAFGFAEDGSPDETFGDGGMAAGEIAGEPLSAGDAVALDEQGIVVAGDVGEGERSLPMVARFLPDGGHVDQGPDSGDGDGDGDVAGGAATNLKNVNVHKLLVPKSRARLAALGVRVRASCDEDCRILVEIEVSDRVARAMGLKGNVLGSASTLAAAGQKRWVVAKLSSVARRALRSYSGGGRLHVNVTGLSP